VLDDNLADDFILSSAAPWNDFIHSALDLFQIHPSKASTVCLGYCFSTQRKTDVLLRLQEDIYSRMVENVIDEIQSISLRSKKKFYVYIYDPDADKC
jgi:hypothetical protein